MTFFMEFDHDGKSVVAVTRRNKARDRYGTRLFKAFADEEVAEQPAPEVFGVIKGPWPETAVMRHSWSLDADYDAKSTMLFHLTNTRSDPLSVYVFRLADPALEQRIIHLQLPSNFRFPKELVPDITRIAVDGRLGRIAMLSRNALGVMIFSLETAQLVIHYPVEGGVFRDVGFDEESRVILLAKDSILVYDSEGLPVCQTPLPATPRFYRMVYHAPTKQLTMYNEKDLNFLTIEYAV